MGRTPPFFMRSSSSVPSSIMVRSAAKLVSYTLWKPSLLRAATILPVTGVPMGIPNSSPNAARTAGAVCTITCLPALKASSTLSISDFSINAPVGHTVTHCPHSMQGDFAMERFSAGATMVRKPRFSKPSMLMPWALAQRAMQRPHRMHLEVSRTIEGVS